MLNSDPDKNLPIYLFACAFATLVFYSLWPHILGFKVLVTLVETGITYLTPCTRSGAILRGFTPKSARAPWGLWTVMLPVRS
jgi:hypothetical protein